MNDLNNEDFSNLNVFCFDLNQYKKSVKYLTCSVFINYKGHMYGQDVRVWLDYYFVWKKYKWVLYKDLEEIKREGLTKIIKVILGEK